MSESPWRIFGEVLALWLVTLLLIKGVVLLVQGAGLPELFLAAVPILFMYMPVLMCRIRGVDSWSYPLALPSFKDKAAWLRPLRLNALVIGLILFPWLVGYHVYQGIPFELDVLGYHISKPAFTFQGTLPEPLEVLKLMGYHVFFVAIPEEFFYRGYVQTRLDEALPPRLRVFGASVGWGLLATCVIFAFGHSIVSFQWWHFAIFFPSLVFGWMRAKTGDVIAGAIFHAWANITVALLDSLYGITA